MNEPRIQKLQHIPFLLDVYGCLLTERQREAISLFYEEDLSLSEIAEIHGSSRQAAHHLIERGESQLLAYENQLHIVENDRRRAEIRDELKKRLSHESLPERSKREIEELLCRL